MKKIFEAAEDLGTNLRDALAKKLCGAQQLSRWRKTIAADRDWDYAFLLTLMIDKMGYMEKHFREDSVIVDEEALPIAEQLHEARLCLARVREGHYPEAYAELYAKWPELEEPDQLILNEDGALTLRALSDEQFATLSAATELELELRQHDLNRALFIMSQHMLSWWD